MVAAGQPWELSVDLPAASWLSRGAGGVLGVALLGAAALVVTGTYARRSGVPRWCRRYRFDP